MAKLDTPFTDVDVDARGSFEVTVETVIGAVSYDQRGTKTVIHAAMEVIADYIVGDRSDARFGGYTFRFPGPHEDTVTTVTVEGA